MLPTELYNTSLQNNALSPDPGQAEALKKLDGLAMALRARPKPRLLRRRSPVRGLYLHGTVGRGKSMLMDLFFEAAPVAAKRRVHFNQFMLDVHRRLHAARASGRRDPLQSIVSALSREVSLLCFDEFQVGDIADAMILDRLFTGLLDAGLIVVATSNIPPAQLYLNGLQRRLFMPFIVLLQQRLDIVEIGSGVDHRLAGLAGQPVWFAPDDETAAAAIDAGFAVLTGGRPGHGETLDVDGRMLTVPLAAVNVARFTFDQLCRAALGPADYIALAARYRVLIVEHVPVFAASDRNESLRFITLVDQLYERRACLIASAGSAPDRLYPTDGPYAFEFRRTISRLIEMQSAGYIAGDRQHEECR